MARGGPWKSVHRSAWRGRRRDGENFLQTARDALALADPGDSGKPVMSNALRAVIAYGDALTIKFAGIKNTEDHAALPDTVRRALGDRAESKQLRRLARLLSKKNDIDYHHRDMTLEEARRFVKRFARLTRWGAVEP